MLTLPGSLRILATATVDFRKSHDGLAALVRQVLGEDPLSGSLFVFANKRADRLKLLYRNCDGMR
jgi:transposase